MKNLIVVYKEKNEEIVNYLKILIETNDDDLEKGIIVGTADNTVKLYAWDEKTWLKKKITMRKELQGDRILFLGNIQGTEKIKSSLDIKFDKHGVICGLIDNLGVITVNPRALDAIISYNSFLKELKSVCNSPIVKRKTVYNDEKRVIGDSLILVALSIAFPVQGLATALTVYTVNAFNDEKIIKKQQMLYGVVRLYREYLDNFMDGNPSILPELNEVIKENNLLRDSICKKLSEIGTRKINCYDKELRIFLSLYKRLQDNKIGKKVINLSSIHLNLDEKKQIEFGISKSNEITDKAHINDKDAIPWAMFGVNAILKHIYYGDGYNLNRSLMYITYPLFEIDKKYLRNDDIVFDGKIIDELLFATGGFPVAKKTEVAYKNGIKNEEYRQSLYLRLKDFNKLLENIILELDEISKAIIIAEEKLSSINDLLAKIIKFENDSIYAISISGKILSDGIDTAKELTELMDNHLFDVNGNVSPEILKTIRNKEFIQSISLVNLRDEFEEYYKKFEDVKELREEELTDLNIKIVFSKEYDVKARYFQYYQNQEKREWEEIYESSPLRYEDRYLKISKEGLEDIINQLCNATALGDINSCIFFTGDKQLYADIKSLAENRFSNVKVLYKE